RMGGLELGCHARAVPLGGPSQRSFSNGARAILWRKMIRHDGCCARTKMPRKRIPRGPDDHDVEARQLRTELCKEGFDFDASVRSDLPASFGQVPFEVRQRPRNRKP